MHSFSSVSPVPSLPLFSLGAVPLNFLEKIQSLEVTRVTSRSQGHLILEWLLLTLLQDVLCPFHFFLSHGIM